MVMGVISFLWLTWNQVENIQRENREVKKTENNNGVENCPENTENGSNVTANTYCHTYNHSGYQHDDAELSVGRERLFFHQMASPNDGRGCQCSVKRDADNDIHDLLLIGCVAP